MARFTPWQMVVEALKAEGIDRVFGLPGNPLHFVADLNQHSDIKPILVRHEHSGATLAYATARTTGRPAVCFTNPGPGITNLATALLEVATCGRCHNLEANRIHYVLRCNPQRGFSKEYSWLKEFHSLC